MAKAWTMLGTHVIISPKMMCVIGMQQLGHLPGGAAGKNKCNLKGMCKFLNKHSNHAWPCHKDADTEK
ncbi:hypothetical protein DUNSADRAFT_9799 [Dunaliella salina]|uniref:Encoded protein n=1 Tax=Dunaliella salina TaxID=3046 RepID=A0ABQ7GGQ5_DUNSA|nr:hypothetical protein DUNSADRAFT_9799 [Dunaliella salina]|eukprot:KAF5833775.1 hypothetical protein DUNSADRAFT_9799 [Dunaliella salina]